MSTLTCSSTIIVCEAPHSPSRYHLASLFPDWPPSDQNFSPRVFTFLLAAYLVYFRFHFLLFVIINIVGIMASDSGGARPKRSAKHCSGCHKPVRGHVGPHGPLCRQPSRQFLTDIPDLANLQQDIEASIQVHRDQKNNLTAELELLNIGSSTPLIVSSASCSSITSPVAALHPLVMPLIKLQQ